ncbi:MAG: hypothetical protein Q4P78_02355 [Rothia sp. (in: high G+C Gram-positive bacteria)]|uniref:hypothetical protein n=1 Tax=Rothia sp. (in: high G+C Gram-positive bacteria) TaxID=1885016 RepID=UPI0026E0C02D|nr:hypothetical protein [Rothia sp. (in: high G+C Gram-positive bacteria)]MDO5750029.1 hypothetical protein [Rothia sp. (in: high G+C Gram-positive bacteria)]
MSVCWDYNPAGAITHEHTTTQNGTHAITTYHYDNAHQLRVLATYTNTPAEAASDVVDNGQQVDNTTDTGHRANGTNHKPSSINALETFMHAHAHTHGTYLNTLPRVVETLPLTQVRLYTYTPTGHRANEYVSDGSVSVLGWDALGYLSSITRGHTTTANGGVGVASAVSAADSIRAHSVSGVPVLHSLERVRMSCDTAGSMVRATGGDGVSVPVVWDECAVVPSLLGVGVLPVSGVGRYTHADSAAGSVPAGASAAGVPSSAASARSGHGGGVVPGLGTGAGLVDPYAVFEAVGSGAAAVYGGGGVSAAVASTSASASVSSAPVTSASGSVSGVGVLPAGVPSVLGAFGLVGFFCCGCVCCWFFGGGCACGGSCGAFVCVVGSFAWCCWFWVVWFWFCVGGV